MAQIEFHYDFGSPNAYLAHALIPAIEARTGAKFQYVPVLLGGIFKATGNRAPMVAFGDVKNKLAYERLEMQRFIKRHTIPFTMNPYFPVNTLMLMRGAVAAADEGVYERYVETMFRGMWVEPKKLDDPQVLRETLATAGLPAERLLELANSAPVKEALARNTERSVARGSFGSPTFFVGDEIFFGKDKLPDVEYAIAAV